MYLVNFSGPQDKRITAEIPVFVDGCKEDGEPFQELTRAVVANVRGGLIELESPVEKRFATPRGQ
jgi:hypothetical protein